MDLSNLNASLDPDVADAERDIGDKFRGQSPITRRQVHVWYNLIHRYSFRVFFIWLGLSMESWLTYICSCRRIYHKLV